ncbi:MAG: aminotransferase class V-fold PLP-dependent enzyme [Acidobacteria bacterium]|nr:aminotransferase class V-fold PLP-dependent enzyme [Acidobacteriota bacterium]MCI0724436.1 aminotransferase class V-fold PLP-dependent enzyme [Acidobacteriota bacterium]
MSHAHVSRRQFLRTGLAMPAAGTLLGEGPAAQAATLVLPHSAGIYQRLGIRTPINAVGTLTTLSGTLMPIEVIRAMEEASKNFVPIHELQEKVGQRLAALTGAGGAFVTAGASAALCLATCAVTAGDDLKKMLQLPDLTGMKTEIIIQKTHRTLYDHAFRMVGVKLVEVETAEQMRRAINLQTAAVAYVMSHHTLGGSRPFETRMDNSLGFEDRYVVGPYGEVSLEEALEIAHRAELPLILDAAAEIPPAENLSKFVKMGVDLVAFSGGKNLRGPQCSGLLLGRKDLVKKAYANSAPNDYLPRIAKVGKEEIVGLLTAVELALKRDYKAQRRAWFAMLERLAERLKDIPTVHTGFVTNNDYSHTPRLSVQWDEARTGVTLGDMVRMLREGEPSIVATDLRRFTPPWKGLGIFPYNLLPGEELTVADRVRNILTKSA